MLFHGFSVVLLIDNQSDDRDYTVVINLRVDSVLYTGKLQDPIKKCKSETVVKRNSGKSMRI